MRRGIALVRSAFVACLIPWALSWALISEFEPIRCFICYAYVEFVFTFRHCPLETSCHGHGWIGFGLH